MFTWKKQPTQDQLLLGKKFQITAQTSTQEVFFALQDIFVLFGLVSHIDGSINDHETYIVSQYATLVLHLPQNRIDYALSCYYNASTIGTSITHISRCIFKKFKRDALFLLDLYDWVERIAMCDGQICVAEKDALQKLHHIFKLKKTSAAKERDPYLLLGCTQDTPVEEIKKAYRQKIAQYHPDTIMAIQPSHEFMEHNMGRFQRIKTAYESIKKAKRF
ncbi:MAG: J domain-containing protein [Spirochaetia bacterium]